MSDDFYDELPAYQQIREFRDTLFRPAAGGPIDLESIETVFEKMQREIYHLRVWIDAAQDASYRFVSGKVSTPEDLSLFNGSVLLSIKNALILVGASPSEIRNYIFGVSPDDDPSVVYARSCMEFAEKSIAARASLSLMQAARKAPLRPNPEGTMSDTELAKALLIEAERKKKAN